MIGYGVENAPFHNHNPTPEEIAQYYVAIPELYAAVRRYANKTVLITPIHKGYEPPDYDDSHVWMDGLPAPPGSNCMVNFDGYGLLDNMCPRSGYTKEGLRATLGGALAYGQRYGVPLLVAEFGIAPACAETVSGSTYIRDLIDVYTEVGLTSWIYSMKLVNLDHTVAAPRMLSLLSQMFDQQKRRRKKSARN